MTGNRPSVNHHLMHKINSSLILSSLRKQPSQSRAKLAQLTGLTRSTISNLTDELIQNNFIHEVGYEESSGGRRGVLLELNPIGGSAIALKINASSVQCAFANLVGDIVWHKLVPITSTKPQFVLELAQELIEEVIALNDAKIPILGIGVGITGLISQDGAVIYSKFLDWENVEFRKEWSRRFNLPVTVDNEVSLAAFGENHYGSATNDSHFIYIEIGYGLGAGVVINGQLYQGINGYAGEVGYITFCLPSNNGSLQAVSWQSMINIPALLATVENHMQNGASSRLDANNFDFEAIIEAAHEDDAVASKAMIELSNYLGMGIANLINTFDIPLYIIGGELGKEFEPYLPYVNDEIKNYLVRYPPSGIKVRISKTQPDASLMGAVAQVFDDILKEPTLNVNL